MEVKVCSLKSSDFASQFLESVLGTGFAVVTDHSIDSWLIKETQDAWRTFFLKKLPYKEYFANKEDPNMGYKGLKTEKAVGATVADLKEYFHWMPGQKMPIEVFSLTQQIFYQLQEVSKTILEVLDTKNDAGFSFKQACDHSDNTIIRTLYYPAMDFSKEPGAVRSAAHEDINFITLLVAASAPGLQVLDKEGNWHDVPHEENSIVVNIGDMLQLASKGAYKSTTHRVVNPDNNTNDRVSMPLFVHPKGDILLAEGKTAQQYLNERISQIHSDKK